MNWHRWLNLTMSAKNLPIFKSLHTEIFWSPKLSKMRDPILVTLMKI